MKNFWPNRPKAKGFSIQDLAGKYCLKSLGASDSSNEISNQPIEDRNLIPMNEKCKQVPISNLSIKRIHWANRDFSEYKEAA